MVSKKLLVALAGLLVVSGVIGLTWLGGGGPSFDPRDPSDDSLNGHTSNTLPNGVNIDGILAHNLVDQHEAALDRSTYTLTVTTRTERGNETVVETTTYEKGTDGTLVTTTRDGEVFVERYDPASNDTVYVRTQTESGTELNRRDGRAVAASDSETLLGILYGGDFEPTDLSTDNDGVRTVTLTADRRVRPEEIDRALPLSSVESFEGRATVDTNQYIWTTEAVLRGEVNGEDATVTYTSELSRVNDTLVQRPSWVDEAESNSVGYRAGLASDGRSIFIAHDGGRTIPVGATIDVFIERDGTYERRSETLDADFEPKQALYLTFNNDNPTIHRGAAPAERGERLSADSYYVEVNEAGASDPIIEFEVVP